MVTSVITLDNGLKIYAKKAPLHSVAIAVGVGYGSLNEFEHPETSGSAHFLEHMLFKGTKNRTYRQIRDEARNGAVYQNAFTDYDNITYITLSPKYSFDVPVSLLSDMIQNSILPETELEKERGAIIGEVMSYNDDPDRILAQRIMGALFENQPPSLPTAGTLESVKKITRERLLDVYNRSNTPDNVAVIAYGDLDKACLKKLTAAFGDFEGKANFKSTEIHITKPKIKEIVLERKEITQASVYMAFSAPGDNTQNRYGREVSSALSCLQDILSRRLNDTVREENGLVYEIWARSDTNADFSVFNMHFRCNPPDSEKIRGLASKELQKIRDGEITNAELLTSKRSLLWHSKTLLDKPFYNACALASYLITRGNLPSLKPLHAIRLEDVTDAADRYLNASNMVYAAMIPKKK